MDAVTAKKYAENLAELVAETMENIAKNEGREVNFEIDYPAAMIIVFAEELYVLTSIIAQLKTSDSIEIANIPQKPKTFLH